MGKEKERTSFFTLFWPELIHGRDLLQGSLGNVRCCQNFFMAMTCCKESGKCRPWSELICGHGLLQGSLGNVGHVPRLACRYLTATEWGGRKGYWAPGTSPISSLICIVIVSRVAWEISGWGYVCPQDTGTALRTPCCGLGGWSEEV